MTTKKTKTLGLAGYVKTEAAAPAEPAKRETNGKDVKPITVKVSKEDWMRLRRLGDAEHTNLQALGVAGFNLILKERGLPPLEG